MKTFLFLILISFVSNAQIKIVDKINHDPISNVEIYNYKGVLLSTTNENGEVNNIKISDYPLTISHFLYHNLEFKTHTNLIKLSPKSIILNDVVVNGVSNKYIIIEGYYRGLQTKNDTLDIFADAKIKWILATKNYKSVGYEIISSRFFLSKKYNFYKQGKIFLGIKLNTLPHFQADFKYFQESKKNNNLFGLNFDDNHGEEIFLKMLGNSSRILINKDEVLSSSQKFPLENLIFFNHKHKLIFIPKKSDKTYTYDAIDEFIPSNIYFSNDLPNRIRRSIIIPEKSNFESDFWVEFEKNKNFKPLIPIITSSFQNTMELIK